MKQGKEDGEKEDASQVETEFICLVIFFSTIFFSQPCLESPILRWLRTKAAPRLNDELERQSGVETWARKKSRDRVSVLWEGYWSAGKSAALRNAIVEHYFHLVGPIVKGTLPQLKGTLGVRA